MTTGTTLSRSPPPFVDFRVNTQSYAFHIQGHLPSYCELIPPISHFANPPPCADFRVSRQQYVSYFQGKLYFFWEHFVSNVAILRTEPSRRSTQGFAGFLDNCYTATSSRIFTHTLDVKRWEFNYWTGKLNVAYMNVPPKYALIHTQYAPNTTGPPIPTSLHRSA